MFFPSVELIFDSSKFYSIYVLDWCIYGGCIPTKLSCYVIECFNVSCTTCRLRASCSTYSLLSCLQIFFTPLSCTLYCSSDYFFWCLVVALKRFSFISRLCSTFCQVFLALWLQIAYYFLMWLENWVCEFPGLCLSHPLANFLVCWTYF